MYRATLNACVRLVPALVLALVLLPGQGWGQVEIRQQDGSLIARLNVAPGQEWCLRWNHSVTGGAVADCFAGREGQLILTRSYLHDFAAGLGHLPGRGQLRSAEEGGYWIESMDEPVAGNALPLRVGGPRVRHRLVAPGGDELDLTELAAGERVILTLAPWIAAR